MAKRLVFLERLSPELQDVDGELECELCSEPSALDLCDECSKLSAKGFDNGKNGCSQCASMMINGTPCHETGCPNIKRGKDE